MRRTLSSVLQVASSSMSANQYKRLMAMSVTLMVWSTILTTFFVWANILRGVRPWVSWEYVHFRWSRVRLYPWVLLHPLSRTLALMTYWAVPVSTLITFIFLGFGEDALKGYKSIASAIASKLPYKVLLKRNETFWGEKSHVPPVTPSGLRFAPLPTLQFSPPYPSQRSPDGPPTPPPANPPATDQTSQELPQIQPVRSLYSMIGPPRLKAQSQSSEKSYGWRWSARSEEPQPASSESDGAEQGLYGCASGTRNATIAEPRELLTTGLVQEAVQGGEPHDQV